MVSYLFFRVNRKVEIDERVVEELSILKDASERQKVSCPKVFSVLRTSAKSISHSRQR